MGIFDGITNTIFPGLGSIGDLGKGLFGTQQGVIDTSASNSPWAPVQPYLTYGFGQAQDLYKQGTPQTPTLNAAQGLAQNTIAGNYLTPDSNPYLKASTEDALGLARSSFAGQYGGQAGGNLGNSGYQEALARTLGNVATNAYSNAYQQERGNQQAAMSAAPGLDMTKAQMPWMGLQNYMGALSGGLGNFGQSTNQQPYYQNNTANTLGALAGGAGIYKMFSDRRLKSNIVKIGEDPRGFGIYEFDIFGQRQKGVMADEIEKIIPKAVSEVSGYKVVDYGYL